MNSIGELALGGMGTRRVRTRQVRIRQFGKSASSNSANWHSASSNSAKWEQTVLFFSTKYLQNIYMSLLQNLFVTFLICSIDNLHALWNIRQIIDTVRTP